MWLTLLLWSLAGLCLVILVTSNIERLSYAWLNFRAWLRRRMTITTDAEWPHLPPPKCKPLVCRGGSHATF